MVRIAGSHPAGPGSIPGAGNRTFFVLEVKFHFLFDFPRNKQQHIFASYAATRSARTAQLSSIAAGGWSVDRSRSELELDFVSLCRSKGCFADSSKATATVTDGHLMTGR